MASFNFPFHIAKDKPAVAAEVQTNFDAFRTWVLDNVMQKDGTNAATGPITLPPGPPSAPDQAANKAYVDALIPIGTIWEYGGVNLPANWLWCDGQTYTEGSQQPLFNAIQRNFTAAAVPTGSFQVPDKRVRVSIGADAREAAKFGIGVTGGQRNSEVFNHAHTVPIHGHGFTGSSNQVDLQHQHPVNIITTDAGAHGHNLGHGASLLYVQAGSAEGSPGPGSVARATWLHDGLHNHGVNGHTGLNYLDGGRYHTHSVGTYAVTNAAAFNTTENGGGTTLVDKNLPPYVAVNYMIYAGPV